MADRVLVTTDDLEHSVRINAHLEAAGFHTALMSSFDDVRRAVEHLFDVKVVGVNIQNRKGKPRKSRFRGGTTNAWKKAIVTLDPEHRINFF